MFDSFFEVTILALVQGVAEFLPISSSGHLVICQHAMNVHAPGMRLDLALHAGTLASICVFYARTIATILRTRDWQFVLKIFASAIPAVLVYFFFRERVDEFFENSRMVGALLMFTGAILLGTRYLPRGNSHVTFWRAILMGVGQAIALLPGISRSGMTLACARAGRVDAEKSAEFSFLMSAPLIIGGIALEIIKDIRTPEIMKIATQEIPWSTILYGAVLSAIVGYFSLVILVKLLKSKNFWMFGPYCFVVGILTLLFLK